jgi:hypothetical protein
MCLSVSVYHVSIDSIGHSISRFNSGWFGGLLLHHVRPDEELDEQQEVRAE